MQAVRLFQQQLAKRPLPTQMVVSGAISGAGDVFAQWLTGEKTWDKWRTARFIGVTTFFIAPSLSVWFRVLERVRHGHPKLIPLQRVVIDQACFSPVFNGIILLNLRLLEGLSFDESVRKLKNDWWTIYMNSLKLWPAVQLFNFYFMPLNYRVILIQLVAFFWNTYLSYATQTKVPGPMPLDKSKN